MASRQMDNNSPVRARESCPTAACFIRAILDRLSGGGGERRVSDDYGGGGGDKKGCRKRAKRQKAIREADWLASAPKFGLLRVTIMKFRKLASADKRQQVAI